MTADVDIGADDKPARFAGGGVHGLATDALLVQPVAMRAWPDVSFIATIAAAPWAAAG